jgi:hypothetical protein
MPINGYFNTPFAVDGSLTPVPDGVQTNGTVSYNQGWGILYATPVGEGGYNIDRATTNQLFNDITTAIQAYQQFGVPPWISSTMNLGTSFPYAKYARVLYTDGHVYLSLVGSNTVTPVNDGVNWQLADASVPRRTVLGANTSYYVATTGSDSSGNGSMASPWATIPHAINVIQGTIDFGGYVVTLNVADGTYTGGIAINGPFVGNSGGLLIVGDTTTPANCIISTTSLDAVSLRQGAENITLEGFTLQTTTSGHCLNISAGCSLFLGTGISFGACAGSHIFCTGPALVQCTGSAYSIVGGAQYHINVSQGATVSAFSQTVTLTGTPAFSSEFAFATDTGNIKYISNTFSGSATGTRYLAQINGTINTNGGGSTYLPGNAGGSVANGGIYV